VTTSATIPALAFDGVTILRGGRAALDNVTLALPPGSLAAVLGPNGAGKSTLLRAANGELRAAAGSVRAFGTEAGSGGWRAAAAWRRRIGVMPQQADHAPAVPLTVREVVEIGRASRGRPGLRDRSVCDNWMNRFGLQSLADRSFGALSGGEQRKVHLARVFAQEPELILLDEPAGHLDLPAQDNLIGMVAEVWHETRATVVIVTHELRHLPAGTTHVILLSKGRIVAAGAPEAVLTSAMVSAAYGGPLEVLAHAGRYAMVPGGRGGAHGRS